jgi:hypothetical protein
MLRRLLVLACVLVSSCVPAEPFDNPCDKAFSGFDPCRCDPCPDGTTCVVGNGWRSCLCEAGWCVLDQVCCAAGSVCRGGVCCTPDCTNRECGGDGCGGSCNVGDEPCAVRYDCHYECVVDDAKGTSACLFMYEKCP